MLRLPEIQRCEHGCSVLRIAVLRSEPIHNRRRKLLFTDSRVAPEMLCQRSVVPTRPVFLLLADYELRGEFLHGICGFQTTHEARVVAEYIEFLVSKQSNQ